MKKPLLIVGIDPGTTVGYTILDLQGKSIIIDSAKELDLDKIVAKTAAVGIPLAVGCDKAKVPGFVDAFATKVGAKLFWPEEDLKVDEKREMTKSHSFRNSHELDSLASALFAFKKIEGLLRRIDKFLAEKNKTELAETVKEIVVKKGINIAAALEILTRPEQNEAKIMRKVVEERKLNEKDFLKIYNELKKSEDEKKNLKQQNALLQNELQKANKETQKYQQIAEKTAKKQFDPKLKFKEDKIQFLSREISKRDNAANALKAEIRKLHSILANIDNKIVAKKLKNLGWNEFLQKKDSLQLKKGDTLLVDDPNEFSDKTLQQLKGIIEIIIHKKEIGKKLESSGFVFISSDRVKLEENEHFAFVNKGSFEEARRNKELLKNIIENYKKERTT